jgi:hypothetical protein
MVMSEVAVTGFLDIHSETGDLVRSEPEAAARSTSRSVRMPASQEPSMTTAEPTLAFTILLVTSATERAAEVVRTCPGGWQEQRAASGGAPTT